MANNPQLKCFSTAVDLKRPQCARPFEVVDGDTGNRITVTLTDAGTPVDMTGLYVAAVFSAAHGVSVQDTADGSVTVNGNTAVIRLLPGSVSPGLVECELQIYSTEQTNRDTLVTTARFNFSCRKSMLNDEALHSQPQFPHLSQLLSDIETAEAARAAAENTRISNEGTRQSREAQRMMNENSRVSAEAARASAEAARASAESIRVSAENARISAENTRVSNEQARQAAETQREETFAEMIAEAGVGAKLVNAAPTENTLESVGRILVVRNTDRAYICTNRIVQGGNAYCLWRMLSLESPWEDVRTITLTSDQTSVMFDETDGGAAFEYDELELVIVGAMKSSCIANIYVNGNTEFIKDSVFMNRDVSDLSKNMTIVKLSKMREGFVLYEKSGSGIADTSTVCSVKAIQSGFLKLGTDLPYSTLRVAANSSTGKFAAGTVFKLRGRNIVM